jgi:hypothetical protein
MIKKWSFTAQQRPSNNREVKRKMSPRPVYNSVSGFFLYMEWSHGKYPYLPHDTLWDWCSREWAKYNREARQPWMDAAKREILNTTMERIIHNHPGTRCERLRNLILFSPCLRQGHHVERLKPSKTVVHPPTEAEVKLSKRTSRRDQQAYRDALLPSLLRRYGINPKLSRKAQLEEMVELGCVERVD